MKTMSFIPKLSKQNGYFPWLYSTLYHCMMLLLNCRAYSHIYYSLKLVDFGLMINCFGLIQSGQNIIRSAHSQDHKTYYFSVRSGSGQKITGYYGVWGAKNLAPQDCTSYCLLFYSKNSGWMECFYTTNHIRRGQMTGLLPGQVQNC